MREAMCIKDYRTFRRGETYKFEPKRCKRGTVRGATITHVGDVEYVNIFDFTDHFIEPEAETIINKHKGKQNAWR